MRVVLWLFLCFSLSFSLSIEELLSSAEEKNPMLKAKKHRVQSIGLSLEADRQLYYPEVFFLYKFSWQAQRQSMRMPSLGVLPPMEISTSRKSYQNAQIGLRQTLYDGGLRSSRVEISKSSVRISKEELKETRSDIRLEVIKSYLSVLSLKEFLEVIKKQKQAVESDLRQREAFYKEGLIAITDVLQARVRLAEVERDLRKTEGEYLTAIAGLSKLTGIEEEKLKDLQPPKIEMEKLELEKLVETALKNRPIIKSLEERQKINTLQRKAELSRFYPVVFAEAVYSYSDQNPNISPKGLLSVGLGLSLSFQSLAPYYRGLALEEEKRAIAEEIRDVVEAIKLSVRSAYERFKVAQDNLKVAETSLKFAEEFYRLSLEQYRNQIIGGAELLQAEASLTQARKARVVAYYELLKAYFELMREAGRL